MKLTGLKSPYRELAEMRHEKKPFENWEKSSFEDTNELIHAFDFLTTNEGLDFWYRLTGGLYTDIPQSSLDELKAWQEAKEPKFEATLIAEPTDHRLFTAAVAAMQGLLSSKSYHVTDFELVASTSVAQAKALIEQLNKVNK